MSDRIEKMNREIKKYSGLTILVYFILIIWLIFPTLFTSFLKEILILDKVTTLIFGGLAMCFFLLDTHNWFDKMFFGERKKTDDFIRKQITKPCNEVSCGRSKKGILDNEKDKLMDLFYIFIPADDTERERSFSYWKEYFITVNLSVFSILCLIISLIYIAVDFYFNQSLKLFHPAFVLILISSFFFNILRCKMKIKLISPTRAQTTKILSNNKSNLIRRLPDYRVDCEDCPLRSALRCGHE